MGSARGIWDAGKHPRGFHGRFGARTVTENGKTRRAGEMFTKRALFGYNLPSATTRTYSDYRPAKVTKWEPGIYSGRDALVKYRYKPTGWEAVGAEPRPTGTVLAHLRAKKAKKRRY